MTRKMIVLALALLMVPFAAAKADTDCPGGTLGTVPLTVAEKANLGTIDARFCVVVPPGYDGSGATTYPILFLLHGAGDTFRAWTHNTDVSAYVAALHASGSDVVVVMPDGGGTSAQATSESGWYTDWADGSRKWETFHIDYLVPYAVAAYHGDASKLMVAGLSMGGYGAMKYASRHPGLFAAAASFSGAVDTMYGFPIDAVAFKALHSLLGTPDERVWGLPTDVQNWRDNNPSDPSNVPALAGLPLYLASGDGLPIGAHDECNEPTNPAKCAGLLANPTGLGSYGLEFFILQMNASFESRLTANGIPYAQNFYTGGSHSWPYWQDMLHWSLPQMLTSFA